MKILRTALFLILTALGVQSAYAQATQLPLAESCFSASTGVNGSIGLLGTIAGGSSYVTGTYGGVALTGGSGTGANANITVSGGIVTGVAILNPGSQYQVGDTLSASNTNLGGAGSGFSFPVASVGINSNLAGGSVAHYVPNTLTFKQTWKNSTQTTPNTNPLALDANGCAVIYGVGSYRQIVKDSNGNTVWDQLTTAPASSAVNPATSGAGDFLALGTVIPIAGFTAPTNYVLAYGQAISRTTYSDALTAITINSSANCTSGNATISGITDTSQVRIGAPVEASCLAPGTTVATVPTATTITVTPVATANGATTLRIFNWGNGNGTTTFNVPDMRGLVLAGPDSMGGVAANRLSSTYFVSSINNGGATPNAPGARGGLQNLTILKGNIPSYNLDNNVTLTGSLTVNTPTNTVYQNGAGPFATTSGGASWQVGAQSASVTNTLGIGGTVGSGGSGTPAATTTPTLTMNYAIKVLNGTLPQVGVLSLGGMTGDITCGTGLSCLNNVIAATGIVTVALTQNHILVGDASNLAADVAMSGDCTVVAAGTITCTKTGGVAFGPFATGTAASGLTGTVSVAQGGFGADNSASTGIVAFSAGTPAFRTLLGTSNEISVANGTGAAGNPSISLPTALTFTGKTVTGGTYVLGAFSGTGAFTALSATFNQNSDAVVTSTNSNAGTAATAGFSAVNNIGSNAVLGVSSSGFTPSGVFLANQLRLGTTAAGGVLIDANSGGPTIFATSNVETVRFDGATVRWANYTCAGGGGLLHVDGSGNMSCSNSVAITGGTIDNTTIGATTASSAKVTTLQSSSTNTFTALAGLGTGCPTINNSGTFTGVTACSGGTSFPAGGVKGDLPYYSAANTGTATTASDANIVIQGGDPSGSVTSTAAAVLAYGYSRRIVLPPAPGSVTGTYKFSTNLTFPNGTELHVPCGVILAPDSGKIVRNLGRTLAADCVIAGGAGTVYLGRDVRSAWWPSTGGDDALAINAADASTNNASAIILTGSISTTTLTVTAMASGFLTVGKPITGAGVTAGTFITALGSGTGEAGTYTVNNSQTVGSEVMTSDSADGTDNIIHLSCRTYTLATAVILNANFANPQTVAGCGDATVLSASGGSFSRGVLTQAGTAAGVGNDLMSFTWRDFAVQCSTNQNVQGITLGTTTKAIRSYTKNRIDRVRISDCRTGIGWYNTRLMDLTDLYILVHGETTSTDTAILMDFDDNNQFNGDSDIYAGQFVCAGNTAPSGGAGYGVRMKSEKTGSNIAGIRFHASVFYDCNKMVYATWASTGTMGDHWFTGGVQCDACGNLADYSGSTGSKKAAMLRFHDVYFTSGGNGQPTFRFVGGNTDEIIDVLVSSVRARGGGGCATCRFVDAEFGAILNALGNQLASFEGTGANPPELFNFFSWRKPTITSNTIDADGITGAVNSLVTSAATSATNDVVISGNNARSAVSATFNNANSASNRCVASNLPSAAVDCP